MMIDISIFVLVGMAVLIYITMFAYDYMTHFENGYKVHLLANLFSGLLIISALVLGVLK